MGNRCELLINTVSIEVPKLLLGIDQKGMWQVVALVARGTSLFRPPVEKQALTRSCNV